MVELDTKASPRKNSRPAIVLLSVLFVLAVVVIGAYLYPRFRENAKTAASQADRKHQIAEQAERASIARKMEAAAKSGDVPAFAAIVERMNLVANNETCKADLDAAVAALTYAAAAGKLSILEYWYAKGLPQRNGSALVASTCLTSASNFERPNVVRFLLEQRADADVHTNNSLTPLAFVAMRKSKANEETARLLVGAGANVNFRPNYDMEYAYTTLRTGKDGERIVSIAAPYEDTQRPGWTPLMFAAKSGSDGIVWLLLSYKADSTIRDSHGLTALDIAKKYKHPDVVRLLEEHR